MQTFLAIIILIVVMIYGLNKEKNEKLESEIIPFFYGEVKLIEQQIKIARYLVVATGLKVDIDNSSHIRLVQDQLNLPYTFFVIAPFNSLKYIEGTIPNDLIQYKSAKEYLDLRKKYHGV